MSAAVGSRQTAVGTKRPRLKPRHIYAANFPIADCQLPTAETHV